MAYCTIVINYNKYWLLKYQWSEPLHFLVEIIAVIVIVTRLNIITLMAIIVIIITAVNSSCLMEA